MGDESLLELIQRKDSEYYGQRNALVFPEPCTVAESIGRTYEQLRKEGLRNLHKEYVFTLHEYYGCLDSNLSKEYFLLVEDLTSFEYRVKNDGAATRALVKTSSWYHRRWATQNEDSGMLHGLFNLGLVGASALVGGIISGGVGALIGAGVGLGAWYGGFKRERRLKGTRYQLDDTKTNDIMKTAHRLHYVAQQMYEQAKDIDGLDMDAFAQLTSCGLEPVLRQLEKAQSEVKKVVEYSGRILDAAGISRPVYSGGKEQHNIFEMKKEDLPELSND